MAELRLLALNRGSSSKLDWASANRRAREETSNGLTHAYLGFVLPESKEAGAVRRFARVSHMSV
jgi:hypothetical protein